MFSLADTLKEHYAQKTDKQQDNFSFSKKQNLRIFSIDWRMISVQFQ